MAKAKYEYPKKRINLRATIWKILVAHPVRSVSAKYIAKFIANNYRRRKKSVTFPQLTRWNKKDLVKALNKPMPAPNNHVQPTVAMWEDYFIRALCPTQICAIGELRVAYTDEQAKAYRNSPLWLYCDGSKIDKKKYPQLHKIIGSNFGGCVPDLRKSIYK